MISAARQYATPTMSRQIRVSFGAFLTACEKSAATHVSQHIYDEQPACQHTELDGTVSIQKQVVGAYIAMRDAETLNVLEGFESLQVHFRQTLSLHLNRLQAK